MTTNVTSTVVANKMVNGNNSNTPSHNNVTNGAKVNAVNAVNLSGTSAAAVATAPTTNNADFGDNLNSKSEFFFLYTFF